MNPQVILVVPPYGSILRPPLGVSALKAGLTRRGIAARVAYTNFDFASLLGARMFEAISEFTATSLAGEWTFSAALNGYRNLPKELEFVQYLERTVGEHIFAGLLKARRIAPEFVRNAARELVEARPRIVGFTSSFQQNCAALAMAKEIRRLDPGIVICMGGANCEGPMGRAILDGFPQVDCVFSGESDASFPEFAQRLLEGRDDAAQQPGIMHRGPDRGSPEKTPIHAMDELPIPDHDEYFEALARFPERAIIHPAITFETSRGCWWGAKHHCTFCGLNGLGMDYRRKSAGRVLEEIHYLHERHGVHRFSATDNILDHRLAHEVFERLADSEPRLSFFFEVKSNLPLKLLERAATGGLTWIQPGIESLADETLASMDKGVTGLQNIELLREAEELHVVVVWSILAGFPGDHRGLYERTARMIPELTHLCPPISVCRFRIDRFSPTFQRAREYGIADLRPFEIYGVLYDLPPEQLFDIAYFFSGTIAGAEQGPIMAPTERAVAEWRRAYYTTPERRPRLVFLQEGSRTLVFDTRPRAIDRLFELDPLHRELLEEFRHPAAVARVLGETPEPARQAAFDELVRRGFVLVDRTRALTVVARTGRRPVEALDLPPFGFLEHEAQAEQEALRRGVAQVTRVEYQAMPSASERPVAHPV